MIGFHLFGKEIKVVNIKDGQYIKEEEKKSKSGLNLQ